MTIDHDESGGRDDLAPIERLNHISAILASGIHRRVEDIGRSGGVAPCSKRGTDGLELGEPVGLDRPIPHPLG